MYLCVHLQSRRDLDITKSTACDQSMCCIPAFLLQRSHHTSPLHVKTATTIISHACAYHPYSLYSKGPGSSSITTVGTIVAPTLEGRVKYSTHV